MRTPNPIAVLVLGLGLVGRAHAEVDVVATVPDLAALARELGGDHVKVQSLALSTQDPHFVDARPNLALALNRAELLLVVGLELEQGWLPTLLTSARNPAIQVGERGYLDCSTLIAVLETPSGPVDRSQGDVHPGGNPHYLFDPRNAFLVARGIAARFAALDPDHSAHYRERLVAFTRRLNGQRKRWEKQLAPFAGAPIVTFHKSLAYLARWVKLDEVGQIEPKPGIPPNPAHVARLLSLAKKRKVRAVVQEHYYPEGTSKVVAQKIPAPFVRLHAGTDFKAGETYGAHMDELVRTLALALGGGK